MKIGLMALVWLYDVSQQFGIIFIDFEKFSLVNALALRIKSFSRYSYVDDHANLF